MMNRKFFRRASASIFAICTLLALSIPAFARPTTNPIELISDGGFTFNRGVSTTTKLFVDIGSGTTASKFWVRVENDPGIPPEQIGVPVGLDGTPVLSEKPNITISIKYFPMSRYLEVMRALRDVKTFGVVNPYVEGFVICDAPNTTIRLWYREIIMAYNCGSDQQDADAATFQSEDLINALRKETVDQPDMQGSIPR